MYPLHQLAECGGLAYHVAVADLSSDEREVVAESLGLLAAFYRANPKRGYVWPSVYNQLRKYGSDHFGSSEEAADRFAQLADKVRASDPT